jgi:hypothetical protein
MNSFAITIFKPPRERFKEPVKENPDQPMRLQSRRGLAADSVFGC